MTTLKEYKAMMEGATDAVAFVCRTLGWLEVVPPYGDKVDRTKECDKAISECGKIRDALNKQADLIRVIELAEEALAWYIENDETNEGDNTEFGGKNWDEENAFWIQGKRKAENALSEIRKLKGE